MSMTDRPSNCRNALQAAGKPYPRSGCAVCKTGGLMGCPYERGEVPKPESVATPQPAGCGACGDGCKDRGSCRLADESPKPAGAVPLPEPAFIRYGRGSGDDVYYSADQIRKYGDAREAAAVARIEAALTEASPGWRYDSVGEELDPVLAAELTIRRLARDASAAYAGHHDEQAAGRADAVSMAQRFLRWGLPVTFAPDAGISFDRSYCEKWATWPTGTNLFTADEAADMMRFVLEASPAGAPPAQQPLDDSANNAGVATGSRNESPSESVTRGSPQVTTSPAAAPQQMTTQGEEQP